MKRAAQLGGPLAAWLVWWVTGALGGGPEVAAVLAAAVWMLVWWVSEAVPIAATSLLPIALFPAFGINDIAGTTAPYGSHYVFLFMGGFLIAIALERWDLHRRMALNILVSTGGRPRRLILGFMLATAFLSMWISNTAATLMMLPIALSVAAKMDLQAQPRFAVALLLGTAYSANIGGMSTLVGTPPNVAMAGILKEQHGIEIPFMEWMLLAAPFAALMLGLVYFLLTRVLLPVSDRMDANGVGHIREELVALGPWNTAQVRVGMVFAATALLWIGRRWLESAFGWSLNDTTIAIAAGIALFLLPSEPRSAKEQRPLLTWAEARKLPWDILLLFGGGLALADALGKAGVLQAIAQTIAHSGGWPIVLMIAAFTFVALMLTEVMSNLALTVVMVPIVAEVAIQLGLDPLLLAVPVAFASSCAFMLPMATPPNAIIFGSGLVRMSTMARVGFVLNLLAVLLAVLWVWLVLPAWTGLL